MAYYFQNVIYTLDQIGITDVILPFMLIFTVVFAVIDRTKILGKDEHDTRKFAMIIALVMALAVVFPHVTGGYYRYGISIDVVDVLNQALPHISLLIVAIVMFLLVIGAWGSRFKLGDHPISGWALGLSFLLVVFIFITAMSDTYGGRWLPRWLYFLYDPYLQSTIVAILVFGAIMWFIASPSDKNKTKGEKQAKGLSEILEQVGRNRNK